MRQFVSVWPELVIRNLKVAGRRRPVGVRSNWGFTAAHPDAGIVRVGELRVHDLDEGELTHQVDPDELARLQDDLDLETPLRLRVELSRVLSGKADYLGECPVADEED